MNSTVPYRKFDASGSNGLKVQKFGAPFEGDTILGIPKFCQIFSLQYIDLR